MSLSSVAQSFSVAAAYEPLQLRPCRDDERVKVVEVLALEREERAGDGLHGLLQFQQAGLQSDLGEDEAVVVHRVGAASLLKAMAFVHDKMGKMDL